MTTPNRPSARIAAAARLPARPPAVLPARATVPPVRATVHPVRAAVRPVRSAARGRSDASALRTLAVLTALTAAFLLALTGCDDVIVDDFGVAGYAIVTGDVVRASGDPYSGNVFVSCGAEEPGAFGGHHDVVAGEYRAELEWPAPLGIELEANEWQGVCRVAAPGGSPPFATAEETVTFSPTRAAQVETRIDLVEDGEG